MNEAMSVGAFLLGVAVGFGLCEYLEGRAHRTPFHHEDRK